MTPKLISNLAAVFLALVFFANCGITSFAKTTEAGPLTDAAMQRRALPIASNERKSWPIGPSITAETAILMEAETGTILYDKGMDTKMYPASTTKMMTCLLAMENCALTDNITFSYDAVHSIPPDGSSMGIDAGEVLPLEECLYGIMVASANEVAAAVAEHIAGSQEAFADMMNKRAAELGCTNTHFVNSNGLYDPEHYTSAHDLALIANAYFQNDALRRIGNTPKYHFEKTPTQPDDFYKTNKHQLITGETPYEGIIGGKTGYTGEAGQTLVTGCEQNGMRLICVVMKEDSPYQFLDTVSLFDYGYQNFTKVSISDADTAHTISSSGFFETGQDIFGSSAPFLSLSKGDYVIVPNLENFSSLDAETNYHAEGLSEGEIATVTYSYHGTIVGSGTILLSTEGISTYQFQETPIDGIIAGRPGNVIFINIKLLLSIVLCVAAGLVLLSIVIALFRQKRKRRKRRLYKSNKLHW